MKKSDIESMGFRECKCGRYTINEDAICNGCRVTGLGVDRNAAKSTHAIKPPARSSDNTGQPREDFRPFRRKTLFGGQPKTKCEADYGRVLYASSSPGDVILYEGMSLKLRSGNRYTPDWVIIRYDGMIECHEVKQMGKTGFRQPSYQRARVAFAEAAILYPFRFIWAEKFKGEWSVK